MSPLFVPNYPCYRDKRVFFLMKQTSFRLQGLLKIAVSTETQAAARAWWNEPLRVPLLSLQHCKSPSTPAGVVRQNDGACASQRHRWHFLFWGHCNGGIPQDVTSNPGPLRIGIYMTHTTDRLGIGENPAAYSRSSTRSTLAAVSRGVVDTTGRSGIELRFSMRQGHRPKSFNSHLYRDSFPRDSVIPLRSFL